MQLLLFIGTRFAFIPIQQRGLSRLQSSSNTDILHDADYDDFKQPHDDVQIPTTSPIQLFLKELRQSMVDESLLKLVLSENSKDEFTDEGGDEALNAAVLTGRLINAKKGKKGKKGGLTRMLQLMSFQDKKMHACSGTTTYIDEEEAISWIEFNLLRYKMATLSTNSNDFVLKQRKGQGKFSSKRKGAAHVDAEGIQSESLVGIQDPAFVRRVLEDRRLLLLTDPENREYKELLAEAKYLDALLSRTNK